MVGLVKINTPKGKGVIEKMYVSELDYVMVKVSNPDKTFTTYNLGKIKDDLSIDDLIIHLTKNNVENI
jgi:hypothetical protein